MKHIDATLIPPMNSDAGIVDAARVSFAKQASMFTDEENGKLLKYLKGHGHWSPYGHAREIFALDMGNTRTLRFLLHANLAGFTWLQNAEVFFLSGSVWAFHENMAYLPPHIADAIRRWFHEQPQYALSAPLLFREAANQTPYSRLAQNVPARDVLGYEDLTSISFRVKAPIFLARQMVKHQVHMCWNEESRRYISDEPEFFLPKVWRSKPTGGAKQGSTDAPAGLSNDVAAAANSHHERPLVLYNQLLHDNVAPELARMVLPQSMVVNWIWTASVSAWARVCRERLAPGAQREAQWLARQIDEQMSLRVPNLWNDLKTNRPYVERG